MIYACAGMIHRAALKGPFWAGSTKKLPSILVNHAPLDESCLLALSNYNMYGREFTVRGDETECCPFFSGAASSRSNFFSSVTGSHRGSGDGSNASRPFQNRLGSTTGCSGVKMFKCQMFKCSNVRASPPEARGHLPEVPRMVLVEVDAEVVLPARVSAAACVGEERRQSLFFSANSKPADRLCSSVTKELPIDGP